MITQNLEFASAFETETIQPSTAEQPDAEIARYDRDYGKWIVESVQRRGFSLPDAEDAKQEALQRAFQYRLGGKDISRPVRWLLRVALNAATDGRRKRRREDDSWQKFDELAVASGEADPHTELCRGEDSKAMEAVIATLPPKQEEVIRYRRVYGLSNTEISKLLRITDAAVKHRMDRAITTLRQYLLE